MSARMIRNGGRAVFAIPFVVVFGGYILGLILQSSVHSRMSLEEIQEALVPVRLGGIALELLLYSLFAFVFWSSKNLFNKHQINRFDAAIYIIIGLAFLGWILGLFGGTKPAQVFETDVSIGDGGLLRIASWIVFLLTFAVAMWFAAACRIYGRLAGSRIWIVTGWLYFLTFGCLLIVNLIALWTALVASAPHLDRASDGQINIAVVLLVTGIACGVVGWICHGAGLLNGARRVAREEATGH